MPLPPHFAFPVFPYLFPPAASLPCEGHGPVLVSSPLLYQVASSSLAQGPSWQREGGCQAQPFPSAGPCWCCVSAVNQGSRVVLGSGGGQKVCHVFLSPGDDISIFHNHTHIILY